MPSPNQIKDLKTTLRIGETTLLIPLSTVLYHLISDPAPSRALLVTMQQLIKNYSTEACPFRFPFQEAITLQ